MLFVALLRLGFHYILLWIVWCAVQSAAGWEMMSFGAYSALFWIGTGLALMMEFAIQFMRAKDD